MSEPAGLSHFAVANLLGVTADDVSRARVRLMDSMQVDERGCWLWTASKTKRGYGRFTLFGRRTRAHIAAWMLWRGPVPTGYVIDHQCNRPSCCNPAHVLPATQKTNTNRAKNAAAKRTHCPKGHPLSGDNLYTDGRGYRGCRACRSDARARHNARRST